MRRRRASFPPAEPPPPLPNPHARNHPLLPLVLLWLSVHGSPAAAADPDATSVTINRHHRGDMFVAGDGGAEGALPSVCRKAAACGSVSGGTAGPAEGGDCACQCLQHLPVFRDDLHVCIDDIHECSLAPFVSSSGSQRIPFVFLPLEGQIVHPSAEISFTGASAPICVVSGAQFLTRAGWADLRSGQYTEPPFRLYRDEGRTFLQWLGAVELRLRMEGRLILVRLLCKDVGGGGGGGGGDDDLAAAAAARDPQQTQLFSPCVAFRVAGSPRDLVPEVSFSAGSSSSSSSTRSGLSVSEYVAIGVCSLLLGLVYVASVFLYLHVRRRRRRAALAAATDAEKPKRKTSQALSHNGSSATTQGDGACEGGGFLAGLRGVCTRSDRSGVTSSASTLAPFNEEGVVKSNPLLAGRHLTAAGLAGLPRGDAPAVAADNVSYASDSASCCSDTDAASDNLPLSDDSGGQSLQVTAALVHRCLSGGVASGAFPGDGIGGGSELAALLQEAASGMERLPEENVSIVETPEGRAEERPDAVRAMAAGGVRRKLYFNPAFFEPELLAEPPPAAVEFLTKIREVIAIAKHKLSSKRFAPSLMGIPEEDSAASADDRCPGPDACANASLQRDSKARRARSPASSTLSVCRACCPAADAAESKASSIRRWLEDVPVGRELPTASPGPQERSSSRSSKPASPSIATASPTGDSSSSASPSRSPSRKAIPSSSVRRNPHKAAAPPPPPSATKVSATPSPPTPPCPPPPPPPAPSQSKLASASPSPRAATSKKGATARTGAPVVAKQLMDAVIKELVGHAHQQQGPGKRTAPAPTLREDPSVPDVAAAPVSQPLEFEADSLERSVAAMTSRDVDAQQEEEEEDELLAPRSGMATPSDYGDAGPPLLGGALPMEEVLTARNEIFNVRTGSTTISKMKGPSSRVGAVTSEDHDYEMVAVNGDGGSALKLVSLPQLLRSDGYSLVSEVYVNDDFGSAPGSPGSSSSSVGGHPPAPKIRYSEPDKKPGHLTIQVEDSPDNYRHVTDDSDSFEPDTLDRKPSRRKWRAKSIVIEDAGVDPSSSQYEQIRDETYTDSLERPSQILLRTNGSFRSDAETNGENGGSGGNGGMTGPEGLLGLLANSPLSRGFGSLREIYEARAKAQSAFAQSPPDTQRKRTLSWKRGARSSTTPPAAPTPDYDEPPGVVLHAALKQAKRQRCPTPPSKPHHCSEDGVYEAPPPPRPVHEATPPLPPRNLKPPLPPKNGSAAESRKRTLSNASNPARRPLPPLPGAPGARPRAYSHGDAPPPPPPPPPTLPPGVESADSLNSSSEYEAFYHTPVSEDGSSSTLGARVERSLQVLTQSGSSTMNSHVAAAASKTLPSNAVAAAAAATGRCRSKDPSREKAEGQVAKRSWRRVCPKPEDSGYLSTDSNDSKRGGGGVGGASVSETDDSLCDGASESGGESIATDSFFFGSCRQLSTYCGGDAVSESVDSGVGSELSRVKLLLQPLSALDGDAAENSSDSETVSFVTVTTNSRCGTVR